MKVRSADRTQAGFALVLTITLLALLVLALAALSALVKLNGQIDHVSATQVKARQHALLGLQQGISDLQRHAGEDRRVTGMAGIVGVMAHASSSTRNWCGVWDEDGDFLAWLTSGSVTTTTPGLADGIVPVTLVGAGQMGGAGSVGSSSAHSEHVIAGKIAIPVAETTASPGVPARVGSYAFLVLDEGVKLSAYSPPALRVDPSIAPLITSIAATSAQGKLRIAVDTYATRLPSVLTYEQLSLLPAPSAALTQSVLQDNFHHVTLTAETLVGGRPYSARVNLNTTSVYVWRSLLETYNAVPGVTPLSVGELSFHGTALAEAFAASSSGKSSGAPFLLTESFGNSALLATNLPTTVDPAEFMAAMEGVLVVRSDTFRVRAYGESLDVLDGNTVEAVAYCEAVLQRVAAPAASGFGRQFVVRYFRWIGPDDL